MGLGKSELIQSIGTGIHTDCGKAEIMNSASTEPLNSNNKDSSGIHRSTPEVNNIPSKLNIS